MSKFLLKSFLISPAILGAALAIAAPGIAAETKAAENAPQAQALITDSQVLTAAPEAAVSSLNAATLSNTTELKVAQAIPTQEVAPATSATDARSLDQINQYVREGRSNKAQVTSVSQLTDVRPTDWAFQALQSLVERYGCIVGYPDKTYRGNRAMTRYEFAAGLNACLDKIQELIAAATADFVKKEDLEVVKRLQEEFASELAALRGRVDALEVRTATLEKQQFSTTTKLTGEAIFALSDEFAQPGRNEAVFQNRVRLLLSSSFTGQDKLVVRLAAGNANAFNQFDRAGNNQGSILEGFQSFNFGSTGGNRVFADWVAYYFPIGENIQVYLPAYAGLHYDYQPTHSGFMEDYDGGNGALSYFGSRNPIYAIGGGSGLGVTLGAGKPISLSVGYLADNGDGANGALGANNPARGNGLFNGSYSAMAQLNFAPNDKFSVGLAYVNAFRKAGIFDGGGGAAAVGTAFTNPSNLLLTGPRGFTVNGGGLSAVFKLSDTIAVNGWVSYFKIDGLRDGASGFDAWTYALGLSFADFGKKGNMLGLLAGTPPYRTNTGDIPIHVEGLYRIRLTDNISVTPGVIWVINQGQRTDKDTLIGTLRTTFTF